MSDANNMELKILGMDCAEEVALIKRELVPLLGGDERLGFDLLNGRLTVDLDGVDVTAGDVLAAIERTGLKAETWESSQQSSDRRSFWASHQRAIMTAISGVFGGIGLVIHLLSGGFDGAVATPAIVCYLIGILAGLYLVLPKAWRALVTLRPDMNLLMSVAVIGAIVGEFVGAYGGERAPLGAIITSALKQNQTATVFAAITMASGLGFMLFGLVNLGGWILLRRWHASAQ